MFSYDKLPRSILFIEVSAVWMGFNSLGFLVNPISGFKAALGLGQSLVQPKFMVQPFRTDFLP